MVDGDEFTEESEDISEEEQDTRKKAADTDKNINLRNMPHHCRGQPRTGKKPHRIHQKGGHICTWPPFRSVH